ncbi:dihydroorotase [Halorarum halophilum]|uniref:Dihydroorotase n=1 Tax=Halorarum halophilum TaxID=2743090 RepID=A0A7D5KN17_9EURY|nr:dihydroorotase [Halobaculum halophilum]QLG28102.1 dihydroorotase [Halobaculum halophilum]
MLFTQATLADGRVRDVRVADGEIADVADAGALDPEDGEAVVDAADEYLLPGAIDAHVHFREPGFPHKEDWTTGSRSAAAGGVTTVVDQPNTDPTTTTGAAFDAKADLAAKSLVDYGLNGGVTADWDPESLFDRPLFALGEVFLADSTGDMGIEADLFADAVERAADHGVTVTVHAEDADLFDESVLPGSTEHASGEGTDPRASATERDDADAWSAFRTPEAEAAAVERALEVGADSGADIHIAHTSTPEGVDAASDAGATCEVTPHHLFLSREDLPDLGTLGRMNPPLRDEERREALMERVRDGTVDIVATDHAPHTREEKDAGIWDAPSGVPGVETMLPLLLNEVREGRLGLERVRDLTAANPAGIFALPRKGRIEVGRDADLVLVDLDDVREIRGDDLHSKCGWTPFEGFEGVFPSLTLVRGNVVYDGRDDGDSESFGDAVGRNVRD